MIDTKHFKILETSIDNMDLSDEQSMIRALSMVNVTMTITCIFYRSYIETSTATFK